MRNLILCAMGMLALFAVPSAGQNVLQVELSVPFGTASGKLILSAEHMIFFDDQEPQYSFVVHRQEIQDMTVDTGVLTMQLKQPVRDRSGNSLRLSFKMPDKVGADALSAWWKGSSAVQATPSATPAATPATQEKSDEQRYRAQHDHTFGSCNGQLVITLDRIVYESVTAMGHSRQWTLRDIKEIKSDSPYMLEITPFTGDNYKFQLLGTGIDPADFRALIERITKARAGR
jgi:hypothetical protein